MYLLLCLFCQINTKLRVSPSIQLPPHIQLIKVVGPIRKQEDFSLAAELGSHTHAQRERCQLERLCSDHLYVAGTGFTGKDQASNGLTP